MVDNNEVIETTETDKPAENLFNQEQVNTFVKNAKIEATNKVYSDLGFKDAEEFKAGQTKTADEINKLKEDLVGYQLKDTRVTKLLEKGLDMKCLELITGKTEDEISKQIELLSNFAPNNVGLGEVNNAETVAKTKQEFGTALFEEVNKGDK